MRRGHPGVRGWRNENPRHFRPRGGGTAHYRPPRTYGLLESPRFPPPGPRSMGPSSFISHQAPIDDHTEHHDRNQYRSGGRHNSGGRPYGGSRYSQRQILPLLQLHHMRHPDGQDHNQPYNDTPNYYDDDQHNPCDINNMGDVDCRQPNQNPFNQRVSPWVNSPSFFEQRAHNRPYKVYESGDPKMPVPDYAGHRPPSSDHYGGNPGSAIDNSNTFSRSVDDTVDIVRKRLLNRDSQPPSDLPTGDQNDGENQERQSSISYSSVQQEQPIKKKTHRHRPTVKSNCDKIKNKIVHQLFMMDKDKIHKLMDNPSSSTKFEYAISSLVTESHNSYNRHLRSVAEKSLCSSSTDFIHNDNNTIYEDTFMKHMQCIMDPHDTVFLEDIKPMVLAELSKVLQLNEFDQVLDDQATYRRDDYSNETYYEDYPQVSFSPENDNSSFFEQKPQPEHDRSDNPVFESEVDRKYGNNQEQFESKLFERRHERIRSSSDRERCRTERRSFDNKSNNFKQSGTLKPHLENKPNDDKFRRCRTPIPNFENQPGGDDHFNRSRTPKPHFESQARGDNYIRSRTPKPHFENQPSGDNFESSGASIPVFENQPSDSRFRRSGTPTPLFEKQTSDDNFKRSESSIPLFDNQPIGDRFNRSGTSVSHENQRSEGRFKRSGTPIPLFDANVDILSDDDDPFAELDKQYHVAVDHNFIANDDLIYSEQPVPYPRPKTPVVKTEITRTLHTSEKPSKIKNSDTKLIVTNTSDKTSHKIKEEIDYQLQDMAKSPLKFTSPVNIKSKKEEHEKCMDEVKQELLLSDSDASIITTPVKKEDNVENGNLKQQDQPIPEPQVAEEAAEKSESSSSMSKSSTSSNTRKRSIDQRPSHRKEKRKKSECGQSEPNKQILNKNIIINVNDCASSEKFDAPKSIFNLFFSKEKCDKEMSKDDKNDDSTEKEYSDKYVKRKEIPKKKDREIVTKKKHDSSSSSHSNVNPSDINYIRSISDPSKTDGKTKLKPIDMFEEHSKKSSVVHTAHRNTAPASTVANKTVVEVKKPPILQTGRKLTRRHIATQVVRKCISKETQTFESKSSSSRFCQTDRKKLITRAAQTNPVVLKSDLKSTSNDAFERMKEIDMEIQMLLQEKFKLYSSLESKDSCTKTMQSLGMAVLNVAPFEDGKEQETDENDLSEDAIVEDFTNIPVEELEEIAFETVNSQRERKSRRQKTLQDRHTSESPTTSARSKRSKKTAKTPNISLIEQIITDDRPLEDIISLDDFETPPAKSRKKAQKSQPKKKKAKVMKSTEMVRDNAYDLIKECHIVVIREDFSKYLKPKSIETSDEKETEIVNTPEAVEPVSNIIEDSVENDLQLDMMDVSEDIVIGDMCEVKSSGGKDATDMSIMSICEEIILDNSQSSMEDAALETGSSNECKMYDYSANENLRRDSVTVSGNGDAVLAIECIENDFIVACLDGNVYHFDGDGQLIATLRGSNLAVTCLTIVKEKYGTTVYTGSLDSRIRYYDLETGLEKGPECNVLSPIQTMDRAWDTVFVGTRTGFVLQFECKNNMLIPVSTVKFSEQSILALRAMKEGPRKVLLVAARSESVTIKDAQTGLLLRTLEGPKMTVYALLFEDGKVYCGTSSQQIHVFDYSSGSHVGTHDGGKGAVCLRAAGGLLFAGCYDGCVYVYREGDTRPLAQLRGPSLMLLSLAVVGSKIIAGYKDRSLYIWKMPVSILNEMIL